MLNTRGLSGGLRFGGRNPISEERRWANPAVPTRLSAVAIEALTGPRLFEVPC